MRHKFKVGDGVVSVISGDYYTIVEPRMDNSICCRSDGELRPVYNGFLRFATALETFITETEDVDESQV